MIDTAGKGGFLTHWIGRQARRALLWRSMHPMQKTHKSRPAREPLINVCEAVSAAKVAALGEAKISEPKRSEDGTRRVSSFSCVQKAQFIAHK